MQQDLLKPGRNPFTPSANMFVNGIPGRQGFFFIKFNKFFIYSKRIFLTLSQGVRGQKTLAACLKQPRANHFHSRPLFFRWIEPYRGLDRTVDWTAPWSDRIGTRHTTLHDGMAQVLQDQVVFDHSKVFVAQVR